MADNREAAREALEQLKEEMDNYEQEADQRKAEDAAEAEAARRKAH